MSINKNRFYPYVIIAVLCGLVAGVLGEIITRVYFLQDFSIPYLSSEVNLDQLNSNQSNLIIRDAKKVVVNQDVKVEETINSLRPSLVGVFKEISPKTGANVNNNEFYKLDEPLFVGLIITSDGWVAASIPTAIKKSFSAKGYTVITSDRKTYTIDQISDFKNLPGDLVFFHLNGANNLAVKKNVLRKELSLGQSVLVVNDFNHVFLSSISALQKTPTVLSSDSLNVRLTLAGDLSNDFKNSFVFNFAGDLVALVGADQTIIPAFSYNPYWQSFLKKGNNIQAYLGVNYLDLSSAKSFSLNLEKGAWLHSSEDKTAVIKNSPAALAGLKESDVITWVNNQEINLENDLADIIATYNPGDTLTLVYIRGGVEKDVAVKLGELK